MIKFVQITFMFIHSLKLRKAVKQPIRVAVFGEGVMSTVLRNSIFLWEALIHGGGFCLSLEDGFR